MQKKLTTLLILFVISICSFMLAFSTGSIAFGLTELWQSVSTNNNTIAHTIIWEIRLPRAYIAYVTGGLLALAGLLMQVLLRNPLADPYILGVSGGASVAALSVMFFALPAYWIAPAAFTGAIVSISLVFYLAHQSGNWNPTRLLLTGVVIAAGWGAMINFILSMSPDRPLRGMLFWLIGDISNTEINSTALIILITGFVLAMSIARNLNLLSRGELQAAALGVAVKPVRIMIFLLASLLTAFAVIQAGSIGFIGLVIPHMLRLIIGNDHRVLIPGSILAGGSLLLLSDTLARIVITPYQLPVGVITAFIGVPFFLFLLNRSYKQQLER